MAFLRSWPGMVLIVSLAVAAFFLVAEHRVHLSGFLPYALVALFVVFHKFMHGGHGGHGGHGRHSGTSENRGPTEGGER
jgi:hypothetical protein